MFQKRRRQSESDRLAAEAAREEAEYEQWRASAISIGERSLTAAREPRTPLPVHQLMDLGNWAYYGRRANQERELKRLEEEAASFELGETPEQSVSEELLNISRKHKEIKLVMQEQQFRFERLERELEAVALLADGLKTIIETAIAGAEMQLEHERQALRNMPHLAAEKQGEIEKLSGVIQKNRKLSEKIDQCMWIGLDSALSSRDLSEQARFDLRRLARVHFELEVDIMSMVGEELG